MEPEPYEHADDLICDPACPASHHEHYKPGSGCFFDLTAEDFAAEDFRVPDCTEDDPRIYTTPFNGIPVVNDIEETPPCCHTPNLCGGPHPDCYSALQYDPERAQAIAALRFNLAARPSKPLYSGPHGDYTVCPKDTCAVCDPNSSADVDS